MESAQTIEAENWNLRRSIVGENLMQTAFPDDVLLYYHSLILIFLLMTNRFTAEKPRARD